MWIQFMGAISSGINEYEGQLCFIAQWRHVQSMILDSFNSIQQVNTVEGVHTFFKYPPSLM